MQSVICAKKVGHLSRACRTKKKDKPDKLDRKAGGIRAIEEQDNDSSSGSLEHLHSILQLGTKSEKGLINVKINGISIEMEIDSGAERSTIPLSLFKQKLAGVCKLQSSTVSLQQYDKTPLIVAGECSSQITINQCVIQATFVVADVHSQLPLLGRDWMALLQFDVSTLINQATQIHHMSGTTLVTDIMAEFSDVFKDQLGVLKGFEANVTIDDSAVPRFHKPRPIPFALKEKVEQHLQKQVDEGELIPVDRSDWATPIVVVRKKDGGIRIYGD